MFVCLWMDYGVSPKQITVRRTSQFYASLHASLRRSSSTWVMCIYNMTSSLDSDKKEDRHYCCVQAQSNFTQGADSRRDWLHSYDPAQFNFKSS